MNDDSMFRINIKYIQKFFPDLFSVVSSIKNKIDLSDIKIYKNKKEIFEIYKNNKILFSKYNPIKETARLFKNISTNDSDIIINSFAFGYPVQYLKEIGYTKTLYILELNYDLLIKSLYYINFEETIGNLNINFICGIDVNKISLVFKEKITGSKEKVELVVYKNLLEVIDDKFVEFKNIFNSISLGKNFKGKFNKIQSYSLEKNFELLYDLEDISVYYNKFKGLPGLLVGTGPSLDKYINLIRDYKNDLIIITVDSAAGALIENDIIPDFIVSIDSQDKCFDYLKKYQDMELNYICAPYSNHKIISGCKGNKILIIPANHYLLDDVYKKFNTNGNITGGAGVSVYGLELLIKFGCPDIYITGQDFAIINNQYYAKSSVEFIKQVNSINKFNTLENLAYNLVKKGNISLEKNNTTDLYNLRNYLSEFEYYIADNPEIKFYNLRDQGKHIRNTIVTDRIEFKIREFFDKKISAFKNIR